MAVLYVKEQGALIQKRSERILITRNRQTLLEIPFDSVDSIAIVGNVQVTSQALYVLMQKGIDVNYFSFSGKYLGCTAADVSKNIFLRLAQYDLYQNKEARMKIAKEIVANKIRNQMYLIQLHRWDTQDNLWKEELAQMELMAEKTKYAESTSQLMGMEGKASNLYFKAYGRMFKCKFEFNGRNRRPPRDPINVIISLGYTFLTKEVASALEAESFEMYLGFLHGIRYGRKSLALDIVEEFRQPVIDRMTLKLFNKRMIQEFDFTFEEDEVLLNEEGFRKFCKEFERWMTDKEISGMDMGYRGLIREQVKQLKGTIQQKGDYIPFCLRKSKDT